MVPCNGWEPPLRPNFENGAAGPLERLPERVALLEDRQTFLRRDVERSKDGQQRLTDAQRRMTGQIKALQEERRARAARVKAAAKLAMFLASGVLLAALNLLAGHWLTGLLH